VRVHVWLSRSQATAQSLLGQGLRNSHHSALQLASGLTTPSLFASSAISPKLQNEHRQKWVAPCEQEKHLFALWYQVRDGTLSRRDLSGAVAPIRSRVHELLIAAATNEIGTRENALGKTVRTCRQLLQVEPALWLFVTTVGVDHQCRRTSHSSRCLMATHQFRVSESAGSLLWHGC